MERHSFPVSVKAAIFNDKNQVLLLHLTHKDIYGLPGGHIDAGEMPDEAMHRELAEETGVKGYTLRHADFFMHHENKVVLAYIGDTDKDELYSIRHEQEGVPVWLTRDQVNKIDLPDCYRSFVTTHWPI